MTRSIHIKPVLNGFVCEVGCQAIVFDSREKLLVELGSYLTNPEATEKRYIAGALNKMDGPAVAPREPFPESVNGANEAPRVPR